MSSLKYVSPSALGSFALLLASVLGGGSETCPANSPISCGSTKSSNTCCFNTPGGLLLQTQFWDTSPSDGPDNSWTIHGLWPDNCDGTFGSNCDAQRAYTNITQILQSFGKTSLLNTMNQFWVDENGDNESFWEHEWAKHGTCISTLDPDCYPDYQATQEVPDFFQKTVDLFQGLDTFTFLSNAGITPSSTKTYSLSSINAALKSATGVDVIVQCEGSVLDEAWYFYNVQGSVQTGTFIPTNPVGTTSSCPSTVSYLPKSGSTGGGGGGGGGGTPGTPFSGSGFLNVVEGGSTKGCLISAGTWFTSGTCATYTATASGSGFTLSSSKGKCAVSGGQFSCSSGVSSPTVFSASGSMLEASGSSQFHADAVASGQTQENVFTGSGNVNLQIEWGPT